MEPLRGRAARLLTPSWPFAAASRPERSDAERAREIARRYGLFRRLRFAAVPDLTPQALGQRLAASGSGTSGESLLLVDVREPAEQAVSMLPGAVSAEQFERHRERYRDRTVVAYCTIGLRSGLKAQQWRQQGIEAVNLAGGVLAWAHADQPFVSPAGPTRRVHVYAPSWNLLPASHSAVVERPDQPSA
ncbi:MPT-synthase sulfurylase [Synechococcus sp. RSCCF101]|nr:MPT-synthase sulfurylase [Synechococcus sp. RSCCF101]